MLCQQVIDTGIFEIFSPDSRKQIKVSDRFHVYSDPAMYATQRILN